MKLFVTVGTQLPFDRMVEAVDRWAADREVEVFAQTGPAQYQPRNIRHQDFVDPATFDREYASADLVVAHAGMGSIFTALELHKPLIIMPRLARFKEHRNDHQRATADRFRQTPGIHIADDEAGLLGLLSNLQALTGPQGEFSPDAQPRLLQAISEFVEDQQRPRRRTRLWRTLRGVR
ncbi:MAG: hypothetical protein K0V04_13205 [Deltaproteobacteria bacterium]|nr:hypothetical protein [Deltaproteobacteria bacterium]